MRSDWRIDHLQMTVESRGADGVHRLGGRRRRSRVPVTPDKPVTFDLPAAGVRDFSSYAYLLSARARPKGSPSTCATPQSKDYRNLGVLMRFTAVRGKPTGK